MAIDEALAQMGGVATRRALIRASSRTDLESALASGVVVRVAKDRYALPAVDEARRAAHRLTGVLVRRSACLERGWEVATVPRLPEVAVSRNRKVPRAARRGVSLHRADLGAGDIDGIATGRDRTLLDCLRNLPFHEALTIADSALRTGYPPTRLRWLAVSARGPGSRQVRRTAALASGLAANPFESVTRAIGVDVPGLDLRPQVSIHDPMFLGRPDLVDERLGVVVECDSFAWHGDRDAFARDLRRYTRLTAHGWLVLRFGYDDVMNHPDYVRETMTATVAQRTDQARALRPPA